MNLYAKRRPLTTTCKNNLHIYYTLKSILPTKDIFSHYPDIYVHKHSWKSCFSRINPKYREPSIATESHELLMHTSMKQSAVYKRKKSSGKVYFITSWPSSIYIFFKFQLSVTSKHLVCFLVIHLQIAWPAFYLFICT